jgi:pSer/pThr/pTyr-binding forkhead associated (FHA) protein
MPTLLLQLKNKLLGEYPLEEGASLTIGRRDTNDVVIEDPAVSGHHAKIDALEDRFVLIDLQSKNGSFVNEQLVNSHWLKHEDVITIGEHSLIFNYYEKVQVSEDNSDDFDETLAMNTTQHRKMMIKSNPTKQHRKMMIKSNPTKSINVVRFWDRSQNRGKVKDVEPPASKPRFERPKEEPVGILTYLAGGIGQIKLTRKITTIGKDPTSDIEVTGLLMGSTAATISKTAEGFCFNYIGGIPRPKVNDQPVKKSTILTDQDIIEIASAQLQFSIEK